MKKVKMALSLLLVVLCIFSLGLVPASAADQAAAEPHDAPQPRALCSYCGNTAYITCWGDKTRNYVSTHTYGWFETCTYTGYVSRSSLHCYFCGQNSETYGNHECWEVHGSCGKEYYMICTCQVKDPFDW